MLHQINVLTRLQLANLFGLNVLRHTTDPRARRKAWLMAAVWALVVLAVVFYTGALSFGLILLDASEAVPGYLAAIASIFIFFFCAFTAGGTLFSPHGYEMLCALPVSRTAIVVSRFIRMYAENLALTAVVMVPGLVVYGWLLRPDGAFYLSCIIGIPAVPLLPVSAAAVMGAVIVAISSRMRHKALVEATLSITLVLGVFLLLPKAAGSPETFTPEMLAQLSNTVLNILGTIYPPAVWLSTAITGGSILCSLAFSGLSVLGTALVLVPVANRFHVICRRLFSRRAKHHYQMKRLNARPPLISLTLREFRRYFASGTYVSNTIIGPILGTIMSAALCFTEQDLIREILPIDVALLAPFLVAGIFTMMTPSSVSISMEGRQLWLLKTLPLSTGTILDAKLMMNLLLLLPFWLISELLLTIGLRPGPAELFFQILIPAEIILFSCVFGIRVNLALPLLEWENETAVVKQSASALLGGMGGLLVSLLCAAAVLLAPAGYLVAVRLGICILLACVTLVLYLRNRSHDLKKL